MNENRPSKAEIIKEFGRRGVSPVATFNLLKDYILFSPDDLRSIPKCYYVEIDGMSEYLFDLEGIQWVHVNDYVEYSIVEYEEWGDLVHQRLKEALQLTKSDLEYAERCYRVEAP